MTDTKQLTELKKLHDTGVQQGAWEVWCPEEVIPYVSHIPSGPNWIYVDQTGWSEGPCLLTDTHALAIVRDAAEGMLVERGWTMIRRPPGHPSGNAWISNTGLLAVAHSLAGALRAEMERSTT